MASIQKTLSDDPSSPATSLDSLLNWLFQTQWFGIKLGLDNTRRLLQNFAGASLEPLGEELYARMDGMRIIHVAGTNGKGSVCAVLDALLRKSGAKVGLFTSPHLVQFSERIRINGEMISAEDLETGFQALKSLVADWDPHPTFFELTLALALWHFKKEQCDWVVLETGMGGRLDATNALVSDFAVITPIDYDHQKWLGQTLKEIASEKAGILKPGVKAFSAHQVIDAEEELRTRASSVGVSLHLMPSQTMMVSESHWTLKGDHQEQNVELAKTVFEATGLKLSEEKFQEVMSQVFWPARFQKVAWREASLILDGAHNLAGAKTLRSTWEREYGDQQAVLVFTAVEGKHWQEMLAHLEPLAAAWVFTQVQTQRALPANTFLGSVHSNQVEIGETVERALEKAHRKSLELNLPILVAGSLYLCGNVLAITQNKPFEASEQ